MTAQFQYPTLAHRTQAVQYIADVISDVRFFPPANLHCNPTMVLGAAHPTHPNSPL